MRPEPLDEFTFERLDGTNQRDLIAGHCAEVERDISSAASVEEAEAVVRNACEKFKRECPSRIIRTALERHVREVFERYWGKG
ncbi:MAG: hypothetical protein HRF44_06015 [Ignavibacterium sp.]|jgi:hypothetical protein